MLTSRYISVTLLCVTQVRYIGKGCPQGGILAPLLWNLVMDGLISILKNCNIWCLGYADSLVICVANQDPVTTAEITQHALNLVEDWCQDQSLSVNPKKAEAMLITRKSKVEIPKLKTLDTNIQYQKSVKYPGVHMHKKLKKPSVPYGCAKVPSATHGVWVPDKYYGYYIQSSFPLSFTAIWFGGLPSKRLPKPVKLPKSTDQYRFWHVEHLEQPQA